MLYYSREICYFSSKLFSSGNFNPHEKSAGLILPSPSNVRPCMKTLDLQQAAALLHIHPVTLQSKAKSGVIPGAKVGKCWVFVEVDLVDYIRSNYGRRTLQGEQENNLCHSLNAKTRPFGGSRSPSTDALYKKALARPTGQKRRNVMVK